MPNQVDCSSEEECWANDSYWEEPDYQTIPGGTLSGSVMIQL